MRKAFEKSCLFRSLSGNNGRERSAERRENHTTADQTMNDLIIKSKPGERRKIHRCLSCGTTEITGRRRYCSAYCRQRLGYKLDMRVGLVQALNVRYATFYFSDILVAMDMLTYGHNDIFSFFYPRSGNRTPAEDFSRMADILGEMWWTEQKGPTNGTSPPAMSSPRRCAIRRPFDHRSGPSTRLSLRCGGRP